MEPKPLQKPHPPIWFGGSHPNAIRRATRLAHGFIGAGSSTTAQFAQHARFAREQLHQHQRDPDSFTIGKRVYVAVDRGAETARDRIADALHARYSYFGLTNLDAVAVAGTADDCIAGIRDIAAAGAHMILLNPLYDELQQMQRLATEVLPAVITDELHSTSNMLH